jgi:hypothetical protein
MYTNADSISNKIDEFRLMVKNNRPHIIGVTEFKPKNARYDLTIAELNVDGYKSFTNSMIKDDGQRGCLLYISSELVANQVEVEAEFKDSVWAKIQLVSTDSLVVGCVYRSPSNSKPANAALNRLLLQMANGPHSHLLIIGDFNYPAIDWIHCSSTKMNENDDSNLFLEAVNDAFLFQHVTKPTRCRVINTPSVLDLVFTNEEGMVRDLEICSPLGKSDHSVIYFSLACYTPVKVNTEKRFVYDRGNYEGMRDEFANWDWSPLDDGMEVQEQWDMFSKNVLCSMDRHIPKKMIQPSKKKFLTPLDRKTVAKIKKKHRAWARFIESREGQHYNEFCKYRNQVRKLTRKARSCYEQDIANEAKSNPKKFWSFAKNQTKTRDGVADLQRGEDPDTLTTTDAEKAQALQEQFSSVFTREPDGAIPTLEDRVCDVPMQPFNVTADMVKQKLTKLKSSKSPGPDSISPRIYHELQNELAAPLAAIFNKSLETGKVPKQWKTADVSAIFKKGNRKTPANYRPVSLTNIASKVMESIIRDHILDHMQSNNLLSKRQFGFVKGRSTVLQLLHVMEKWTDMLDQGDVVDAIYMDFAKAFDKVPHRRLIGKMRSYGITDQVLGWVTDFLQDRKQRVRVNGSYSEESDVLSGIPQGSVLGPTLFTLYINDLPDSISNEVYLFADDTKIFRPISSINDALSLQQDIDTCLNWSATWLLEFNKDKCKVLDISTRPREQFMYEMQGKVLIHSEVEKDLGVEVDRCLKFSQHICDKAKKANAIVAVIRRAFRNLNVKTFPMLFRGIVRPHLEYAAAVWNPHLKRDIKMLENVQRRATKLVPGLRDLSYEERLKELKLPTLAYRRLRGDMIEVYKMTSEYYSPDIPCILSHHQNQAGQRANLRGHSKKLFKERARLDVKKFSFTHRVVDTWNGLPEKVISAPSVKSFERRLDKHWQSLDLVYDYSAAVRRMAPNDDRTGSKDSSGDEDLSIEA